ncbi:hypothetical protein ACHAWF_013697 [Thalassiosira exigua]
MRHEPARDEVPIFLAARGRRDGANDRLALGLDALHDSVTQSMDGLVEVVTTLLDARAQKLYDYEVNLKNDYVYNEKSRASMQAKLQESAKAAHGMFASLLMRVAQPDEAGSSSASALGADGKGGEAGDPNGATKADDAGGDGGGDEEPDWDAIMKHEPAKSEVPAFLAARGRREAACARFGAAIDEYQAAVEGYAQELTQTVADLYNARTVKLDEYDRILQHDYVANDKVRAKLKDDLEESAAAAHSMFGELLKRVTQPQYQPQQDQPKQKEPSATGIFTQVTTLGDSP